MSGPDWLTARPVAHRGLHDAAAGRVENSPSAVQAAVDLGYAIEVDLQVSADGEAMVHHDSELGRVNDGHGRLRELTAAELTAVRFRATADRMLRLGELCDLVGGRSTLLLELKSHHDGDRRLLSRTVDVLRSYRGPVAVMSFDPRLVGMAREAAPQLVRGIVAERQAPHDHAGAAAIGPTARLAFLGQALRMRPQFVAYRVGDLPAPALQAARRLFGLPLLTWTVRTEPERRIADRLADQMIFEGFRP
jgi:glycerophosphoryl diester phosphodiesterase